MRISIILVSLLGLSSVIIGALIEHVGVNHDADLLAAARTGIKYHQLYVPILLALVLYQNSLQEKDKLLSVSIALLSLGVLVFSSSLYASFFTGIHMLTYATPVGGIVMMSGWISLALYGFKKI